MKISTRKTKWTGIGCAMALLAGVPAVADDTELLLLNPDPSSNPKPNVLFILDSSGSMTSTEDTIAPYNSAQIYTGTTATCDPNNLYWTNINVLPVCDGSETNYIAKSVFHCAYAANQIAGIGSFTNTMVQYRDGGNDGTSEGPAIWQHLALGYNDSPVECQSDSAVHGDGRSTHLWASNGADLSDPFTSVPTEEISWGSPPRNLSYTVYDGNYLNWKNDPTIVTLSRSVIMKEVAKKVLGSVNNLNVGLMRFNDNQGGPVILGMTDLDANRQLVLDTIDTLPADGATPLSETLYESALYWRGLTAYYGNIDGLIDTAANALATSGPEVYRQPAWDECAKNYTVLLTDGEPVSDLETPDLAPTLPDFSDTLGGRTACTGTNEGDCLDDISEYLHLADIDPVTDGEQNVTTHTIGFTIDLPILSTTATLSGGEYFLADDVESLTSTLLSIIANINDRTLSFTAPAVSVNTFNRTQNLNDLYITMFGARGKAHWPGNLKKYRIVDGIISDQNDDAAVDPDTGFFFEDAQSYWTAGLDDGNDVELGGAAQQLPDPADRKLYTNYSGTSLTATTNAVSPANADTFTDADFGLTGAVGEPTKDEVIRWARGEDVRDEDGIPSTTVRYAMGDPLHSQPAAVVYGGTAESPDMVVYTATNDGYLHAIDAATGDELWSFIPKELLPNLTRLYFDPNSKYKQYGLDGSVVAITKDSDRNGIIDGTDFVYLIIGMRRGGNTFFALDVTDRDSPEMLWNASLPEFGESWSTPVVARMEIASVSQNADKAVVIIGGGYDTVHDSGTHPSAADSVGAGIHILDLVSGARLWRAGFDIDADLRLDTTDQAMTRAIPTRVRVIDFSGDGMADRMYASDMGGQVWRFDVYNREPPADLVTGGVIAQLGAEGTGLTDPGDTRRFYNSPDISIFTDKVQQRRFVAVSIGSGYRAHPFDLSANDRFYSLRDPDVFKKLTQSDYDNYSIITESDLVPVSGVTQASIDADDRGWMFTLPPDQKILADSLTFNNDVLFVAFSPASNAEATCEAAQGSNFLYRVSVINGDPIVPNIESLDPLDSDDERRMALQQGGIAPTPTILFPSPEEDCTGSDCSPQPLACIGVECFEEDFENNPVRTLWTQDGID